MKIVNSSVDMSASSKSKTTYLKQTKLEYWVGDRGRGTQRSASADTDVAQISAMAKKLSLKVAEEAREKQAAAKAASGTEGSSAVTLNDKDSLKIDLLEEFMYRLTGKHFKFYMIRPINIKGDPDITSVSLKTAAALPASEPAPQKAGYGLIFDSSESTVEQQEMAFKATGTVQTEDGRTIDFSISMNMSREFVTGNEIHLRAGDAKIDPLVINVDGAGPQLTQRDFAFDLDNDGDEEQISRLMSGSGFLALDKNEDGIINNGGELFGPTVGNGFEELRGYDSDGNNWIDENDPIYDKLRIWMSDEQGNMQLFALGQKGIGALYLGNVVSSFDIKDAGNNSLGTVQSTGIFLRETGGVGTMQHIDFTV